MSFEEVRAAALALPDEQRWQLFEDIYESVPDDQLWPPDKGFLRSLRRRHKRLYRDPLAVTRGDEAMFRVAARYARLKRA